MPHFTRCMNLSRLFQLKTDYSKDSYISMYGYIEKIALDASSTGTVGEGATPLSIDRFRFFGLFPLLIGAINDNTRKLLCIGGRACHSHWDNSYSTTKTVRLYCKR